MTRHRKSRPTRPRAKSGTGPVNHRGTFPGVMVPAWSEPPPQGEPTRPPRMAVKF